MTIAESIHLMDTFLEWNVSDVTFVKEFDGVFAVITPKWEGKEVGFTDVYTLNFYDNFDNEIEVAKNVRKLTVFSFKGKEVDYEKLLLKAEKVLKQLKLTHNMIIMR
jgi:hypothetical protein